MVRVAVTYSKAFPVDVHTVRRIIGSLAEVVPVEVPGWTISAEEEGPLASSLAAATCVLQRTGAFPRQVLMRLPLLRHIAVHGSGVDKVDLEAATELGIQVTNAPGANSTSVAELAIGLIVMLLRNLLPIANGVASGQWDAIRQNGLELSGKRLGILGTGHVGSRVAQRALALGMEVVAYDPAFTPDQLRERGVGWLPSEEVISTADVLSLHVPLDDTTEHLIDQKAVASMKQGVFFLNLSRGPVVDEVALEAGLRSGRIRAAALDVREVEPPSAHNVLRQLPNVILTPHIGGSTDGALQRIATMCAEDIVRTLTGVPAQWPVNSLGNIKVT